MFLPGITDTRTLDAAAKMCGQVTWKVRGHYHATQHDIATPDMIRQLPAGFALVIRGGCAPVVVRLPRAWNNPAYQRARRAGHATAALQPAPPVAPLPPLAPSLLGDPVIPDHVPDDLLDGDDPSFPWN